MSLNAIARCFSILFAALQGKRSRAWLGGCHRKKAHNCNNWRANAWVPWDYCQIPRQPPVRADEGKSEATEVEYIVAALGAERSGGAVSTAEEFNQLAATFAHARGVPPSRVLTDDDLRKVRARIGELFVKWRTLRPGATLELSFGSSNAV